MMQFTLPFFLLLLVLPFKVAAETKEIVATDVTCSWSHNLVQNPSFELGSLSPWALYKDPLTTSTIADVTSVDRGYVASLTWPTGIANIQRWGSLYQSLTNLTVGQTYTLSYDYKIASAYGSGRCDFWFAVNGVRNLITTNERGYQSFSGSLTTPTSSPWKTVSTTYVPTSTSLDLALVVVCLWNNNINYLRTPMPLIYLDNVQVSNDNVKIETCTTSTYTSTVTIASSTSTSVSTSLAAATSSVVVSSAVAISQTPSRTPAASLPSSVIVASSVRTSNTPSRTPSRTPAGITRRPLPSSSRIPISRLSPSASPLQQSPTVLPLPVPSQSNGNPDATRQPSRTIIRSSSATPARQSTPLVNLPVPQSSSSSHASSISLVPSAQTTNVASSSIASATASDSSSTIVSVSTTDASGSTSTTDSTTETHIQSSMIGSTTDIGTQSSLPPTVTAGPLPGNEGSASSPAFTTSTVFSTRTATITACPSSIVSCPASAKSTYVTTETIVVSTTICPVTATEATATPVIPITKGTGTEDLAYTTSTVFSTRTATITACPSGVPNCPASAKTTSVTTETILVSITVCPVTATATATAALSTGAGGKVVPGHMTTETLLTAVTKTITACPSTVTDCPASQKQTFTTTETLVAGTTAYPAASAKQASVAGNQDASTMTLSLIPVGNGNSKLTETGIAISVSTFPTTNTAIHASASNPTHSFSALVSTAASSSTLAHHKSSATKSSTSTQSYSGVTAAPSPAYTGAASALRSEWLKVIGGIFLVLLV